MSGGVSHVESEEKKFTTVSIPVALFKKIEERIKGTSFPSVSAYVTYVVREILSEVEMESKPTFTREEEEKVKERLRALGYLE